MNVTRIQLERLAGHASKSDVLSMAAESETFPVHRPVVPVDLPTGR